MKLGKIFICINILVLSLLMLTGCTEKWPRIIYQNTSYRLLLFQMVAIVETENDKSFAIGEKYTPSQFKNRNSKTKMVFEILMAWENEFVKIFTLFPEIHAPVLSHFITLKHYR